MQEKNIAPNEEIKIVPPNEVQFGAQTRRVMWIDFSKVICIYLVALGHALSYEVTNECYLRNFIYLFHLPVFFFISGYLYRIKDNEKNFLSYSLSNLNSLVIPYIFLNVLAVILMFPSLLHHDIKPLLYNFLIGHGHAPAGPAWFLLCLYWTKIQMFFIIRLDDKMQLLSALFYCILAYYFPFHLYWEIDASFMAMPIFILGNLIKKHYSDCINGHYSPFTMSSLFLISFAITVCLSVIQQKEAMFSRLFGTYAILFYVGAISGIIMIVSLCKLLENNNNRHVIRLASGSIIIMGLHGIFYRYTHGVFNKLLVEVPLDYMILFKIVICLIVLAEMYWPIIFLQKYCSQFLGGRKVA